MFDGQLYVALGEEVEGNRWQVRMWWKPLVTLIWFGGALVALGGLLSLIGRWRRERRSRVPEQDQEALASDADSSCGRRSSSSPSS